MMRAAHTGRKLPPLTIVNSIERLFPKPSINTRLDAALAGMNAEHERAERREMREFTEHFGIGVGI
jgi:hypothetical protein